MNNPKEEKHPLKPFLPENARILMLGSFPPKQEKWSMNFFYPNFQNDMWRIMGLLFFENKDHFAEVKEKRFNYNSVKDFCTTKGIALFDTASAVKRLKDNASDKFLEITEPTDIAKLLEKLPLCQAIVTTGQKATDVITEKSGCTAPAVGGKTEIEYEGRRIIFYRMPSSSRAYPLSLQKKAEFYRNMFADLNML